MTIRQNRRWNTENDSSELALECRHHDFGQFVAVTSSWLRRGVGRCCSSQWSARCFRLRRQPWIGPLTARPLESAAAQRRWVSHHRAWSGDAVVQCEPWRRWGPQSTSSGLRRFRRGARQRSIWPTFLLRRANAGSFCCINHERSGVAPLNRT